MAVSTDSTFTQTRDQLIQRAARLVGAVKAGEIMGYQEITDFALALNTMVKHWESSGIHVWAVEEATLFPAIGQARYSIGSGADHIADSTLFVSTATTHATDAAGTTSIGVASIVGISSGDYVGVLQTDGSLFWTTVNGAPSGSTVTLTSGLSVGAIAGTNVYTYTSNIVRPLRVVDCRRYNISSQLETPLRMIAREDYQSLPNKIQTGQINQAFYDAQLGTGYMNLWQPLLTITDLFKFTWHRPLHNFDASSDNPDLPDEWMQTIAYNLAWIMAPEYDVPAERFQMLGGMAKQFLDEVGGFDREYESIAFGVDFAS